MAAPDPKLALSAMEVELLRDYRSRLNRLPDNDKQQAVLGAGLFKVCARVGLAGPERPIEAAPEKLIAFANRATAVQLAALVGGLAWVKREKPDDWNAILKAGVGQSILSRRLALAGKEPAVEEA